MYVLVADYRTELVNYFCLTAYHYLNGCRCYRIVDSELCWIIYLNYSDKEREFHPYYFFHRFVEDMMLILHYMFYMI